MSHDEYTLSRQAIYTDDVTPNNSAYADFVLSSVATGDIVSVDPSAALQLPGVIAWISAKDIQPGTYQATSSLSQRYDSPSGTLTGRATHPSHGYLCPCRP
jgi:CO/xanthine dehydrogenase Mo-binding subunit